MSYIGDFAEDYATLNTKFTTRTTAGVPFALASGTISVYKANGTSQSTAGITLTADFDGVVGLNNVLIDLSADAFYAVANDYQIVITVGTVNSVSAVGYVVGEFSIENRFMRGTDSAFLAANAPTNFPALGITVGGAIDDVVLVATTTTNTDMRGTDGVDTATMRGTDSALLAVNVPANFSALGISVGGAIDDVVLVATTTTNTDMITAAQILAQQLTENYAANGAAPTLEQVLMIISQFLQEFGIVGTLLTVNKLDQSTPAATYTLDNSNNPTSITRAS